MFDHCDVRIILLACMISCAYFWYVFVMLPLPINLNQPLLPAGDALQVFAGRLRECCGVASHSCVITRKTSNRALVLFNWACV